MPALRSANRSKAGKTNSKSQAPKGQPQDANSPSLEQAQKSGNDGQEEEEGAPTAQRRPPLSEKAKGKQKSTDSHVWSKQPSGPFLNPFNQSTTRLSTLPREAQYYTTPRSATLPTSRLFVDQLENDVRRLLDAWYSLAKPLTLAAFVQLWKDQGWHLVHYTWGEDLPTREKFFRVVSHTWLTFVGDNDGVRASGAIFALLLLYEVQPLAITPVPGLKDGQTHVDAHCIKMSLDTYHNMLSSPERLGSNKLQQDVKFAIRSLLGLSPESSHPGQNAIHVLAYEDEDSPLVEYDHVTLHQKQRITGQFGHLVNDLTKTRLALSRAEVLLVRAAQALDVPLETLFKDRIEDMQGKWVYIPPTTQRATLFEGKWIDRPLREFDATRLKKFTSVRRGGSEEDGTEEEVTDS